MKKILILLTLVLILVLVLVGCDSNKNKDSDSEEVKAWINSDNAYDINQDGKIDGNDYELYNSYLTWKASDDSQDYNLDRKVDLKDYMIEIGYKAWKGSNDAFDYDDDHKVTFDDWLVHCEVLEWKKTPAGKDFNKDGKVDYYDYLQYEENILLVGKYKILINSSTNDFYFFDDDELTLSQARRDGVLNHVTFEYKADCSIEITVDDYCREYFGTHFNDVMRIARTIDMQRYSALVNEVSFSVQAEDLNITPIIYFTRTSSVNNEYSGVLTFSFTSTNTQVEVSLTLVKLLNN